MVAVTAPKNRQILGKSHSVPVIMANNQEIPKMRKMTEQDQGCFMLVSENVHPDLRLAFPSSCKILAGTVAWLVNKLTSAVSIEHGLKDIFGETEMMDHAVNNVSTIGPQVVETGKYPGNLYALIPYVPVSDRVVQWQITVCVEYVITELLAIAGAIANKLQDQPQYKSDARVNYEDFPQIRPSDLKTAVREDGDLKNALGALFKV